MRRFLSLFAGLTLLCAVGFAAIGLSLNGAQDDVVITEELLYGSASAVSDVIVTSYTHLDRRLLWTTAYPLGSAEQANVEFSFYPKGKQEEYERGYDLSVYPALDFSIGSDSSLDDGQLNGPLPAIRAVAERTQPYETHEEVLTLKDYCNIYPLSVSMNFLIYKNERAFSDALTAYCAIPVPQNQQVRIAVTKGEQGDTYSVSCNTEGSQFAFDCHSVVSGGAAYFTLARSVQDGMNAVLPERLLGIHRADFIADETDWLAYVEDSLTLAYPIDAAMGQVTQLAETEDGTRLLMVTENDEGALLSVIDKATMKLLQSIPLSAKDDTLACLRRENGFLVAIFSGGGFDLITEEGGSLGIRLSGNFLDRTGLEWMRYAELALAYDGNHLAVAYSSYRPEQEDLPYESCAVTALVYDATGLLYAGRYHSSADRASQNFSEGYYVSVVDSSYEIPVSLAFQS